MKQSLAQAVAVGDKIEAQVILTREDISKFAAMSGDFNPLHHDEIYASSTRFKCIVASGPHTAALFMGIVATYFSKKGAMLGIEFSFNFVNPAYADESLFMCWNIISMRPTSKSAGQLVQLSGHIKNSKNENVVIGSGTIMLVSSL